MTHYNPTEHHDKLMKHIAKAIVCNQGLDEPQIPMQNNGKPCHLLRTEDEEYLFTDFGLWNQLVQDALDSAETLNAWRKSFFDTMTEEEYDKIRKVVINPTEGKVSVVE